MKALKAFLAISVSAIFVLAQTAVFPGATVTDSQLKVMVNGMQTSLTASLTATASTVSVSSCGTIPANSLATIDQEIVAVSICSGNTIAINTGAPGCSSGRGCDSTGTSAHNTGALVSLFIDAWHHNAMRVEVEAIENALRSGSITMSGSSSAPLFTVNQAGITGTGISVVTTADQGTAVNAQTNSTNSFGVRATTASATSIAVYAQGTGAGLAADIVGNEWASTVNYIPTETGSNNAIASAIGTGPGLVAGLEVVIQLAHTLQAGANTFAYSGGGALAIKSSFNTSNNIGTAYASTGVVRLQYNGSLWVDEKQ